jgi:hypothetical protein
MEVNEDEFREEALRLLESILSELRRLSGSGDEELVAVGSLDEVTEVISRMDKDSDLRICRRYVDDDENDEEPAEESWIV